MFHYHLDFKVRKFGPCGMIRGFCSYVTNVGVGDVTTENISFFMASTALQVATGIYVFWIFVFVKIYGYLANNKEVRAFLHVFSDHPRINAIALDRRKCKVV